MTTIELKEGEYGVVGCPESGYSMQDSTPILELLEKQYPQPSIGDFGLWGQIYQAYLEPTLAPLFSREVGPRFLAWDTGCVEYLADGDGTDMSASQNAFSR